MPNPREGVASVRSCVAQIEIQVGHLLKGLDEHRAETKENHKDLRAQIQKNEDERDGAFLSLNSRLAKIDQRHAKADGAKGMKATIGGTVLVLLASIGGAIVTLVVSALQGGK